MEGPKEMLLKSPSHNSEKQVLKWIPIESPELPLICGHRAVIYQNYIYFLEGFDGNYTTSCFCFALDKQEWVDFTPRDRFEPNGYQYLSAVLHGHVVYLFGGCRDEPFGLIEGITNEVWCLDLCTSERYLLEDVKGEITARYLHSAQVYDNKMWVFGGRTMAHENESLGDLHSFDFATRTWTEIKPTGPRPVERRAHCCFIFNDKMYLFGGWNGAYCFDDMWFFDFETSNWTRVEQEGQIPSAREAEYMLEHDGEFYLFGGAKSLVASTNVYDRTLYAFNPVTRVWRIVEAENPPAGRESHVMLKHNNSIYVHGGFNDVRLGDLHRLDLPSVHSQTPTTLLKKLQRDMKKFYLNKNKAVFDLLLQVRCPNLYKWREELFDFEKPTAITEIFFEWLFTDQIDENKMNMQLDDRCEKLNEFLAWTQNNNTSGFKEYLTHIICARLNHFNYALVLTDIAEIQKRCEWIEQGRFGEEMLSRDVGFDYPYQSTYQDDLLQLMYERADLVLDVPGKKIPIHSWMVELRCPFFSGAIDFNSLNAQQTTVIKHEPKISISALESIIKYVYSAKLEFKAEDYFDIVKEASYYLVDEDNELFYSEMSEEFMKLINSDNRDLLLSLAKSHGEIFAEEFKYLQAWK